MLYLNIIILCRSMLQFRRFKEMQNNEINNKTHLNIVLKNDESEDKKINIPLTEIVNGLKRFALGWIALAVLVVLMVSAGTAAFSHQLSSSPVSLIFSNAE